VRFLPSFPQRALLVTLSVDAGEDGNDVRVDNEVTRTGVELDRTVEDAELFLQSP
jgi:hypothetical protein